TGSKVRSVHTHLLVVGVGWSQPYLTACIWLCWRPDLTLNGRHNNVIARYGMSRSTGPVPVRKHSGKVGVCNSNISTLHRLLKCLCKCRHRGKAPLRVLRECMQNDSINGRRKSRIEQAWRLGLNSEMLEHDLSRATLERGMSSQ